MYLDIFALCERAAMDGEQLSITRTISRFTGPKLPAMVPDFHVVARLRYEPHEAGPHKFTFLFVDADGNALGPPKQVAREAARLSALPFSSLALLVRVSGLTFERFGVYACNFEMDGEELGSLPFVVVSAEKPTRPRGN